MTDFFQLNLAGRSISQYMIALGIVLAGIVAAQVLKHILLKSHAAAEEPGRDSSSRLLVERIARGLMIPALYLGALYSALRVIDLGGSAGSVADAIMLVVLIWYVVRFATMALRILLGRYFERTDQTVMQQRLKPLLTFANLIIWLTAAIFLLDNLGFKISSIVAGLGIGGITVALAGQTILGDLFSYFVILFDRPFELGDFIISGDILGTIEAIGVKTTKIRSIAGEQIVIANSSLIGSKLHNYKRMERRRVVFSIGVIYSTPHDKLAAIPGMIRRAIEAQPNVTFDRAHFKEFGASSLNFEIVYYVASADYNLFMDTQQAINLRVFEDFARESIEFAFPTQTIYLAGERGQAASEE